MGEDTLPYKLTELAHSDMYPFHMPGHKRRMEDDRWRDVCGIDITEIDGFDNLHHAQGILKQEQQRAARLYGSRRSFFLVNGASCGVLSAICACAGEGEPIVMARGSHKSAYHAVYLKKLRPAYVYAQQAGGGCPPGPVSAADVAEQMRKSGAKAVFLTSPTYEGILSDISAIAGVVHENGGVLIVDEAHGAHLAFHSDFGQSAAKAGADLVIQSLHKTMPALTQTALLHVCSDRVDEEKLMRYLGIFQTSSPSYVLMASISDCITMMEEKGKELFDAYAARLDAFYERTARLSKLRVLGGAWARETYGARKDPSKIVIFAEHLADADGKLFYGADLYALLRERYHLQPEMAMGSYVLAMTSVMDTQEGFDRLAEALFEIDAALVEREFKSCLAESETSDRQAAAGERCAEEGFTETWNFRAAEREPTAAGILQPVQAMTIYEALSGDVEEMPLLQAAGRISCDYLYLYPPGTPFLVPGEIIEEPLLAELERLRKTGLSVQGASGSEPGSIRVIKENTQN